MPPNRPSLEPIESIESIYSYEPKIIVSFYLIYVCTYNY